MRLFGIFYIGGDGGDKYSALEYITTDPNNFPTIDYPCNIYYQDIIENKHFTGNIADWNLYDGVELTKDGKLIEYKDGVKSGKIYNLLEHKDDFQIINNTGRGLGNILWECRVRKENMK